MEKKISKANTGKKHTDESNEKNRQAHLGKIMESTRGEKHHFYGKIHPKNKGGYIIVQKDRISFSYTETRKEIRKSFNINKYGYVKAMKNCLDIMFNKNDYFNKRIKNLNEKIYFLD
jgi:hypothetical protein